MTFAIGSAASASAVPHDLAAEDLADAPQDVGGTESPVRFANAEIAATAADCLHQLSAASRHTDWSWAGPVLHRGIGGNVANAASGSGAAEAQAKNAFKQEFSAKAGNKQEFHAFMQRVYGDGYDKKLAEQYRQQALAGDFSFLPDVKFVDAATLGGGKGAYNEQEGVVYINKDIAASDPAKAGQVFIEEAGAHLDAKLNRADTKGDEGEMFRRALGGEHLSDKEIAAIRNDDDRGTITVDGKTVEVEFWFGEDIVDAVGDAAKDVGKAVAGAAEDAGNAIADGAKTVGNAVVDAAEWAGKGVGMVGTGVIDGLKDFGRGALDAFGDFGKGLFVDTMWGFASNLFQGNFGEALDSAVRGLDRAIFQSTQRFWSGVVDGAQSVANGVTRALGPVGEPLRWVTDRAFDMGHTLMDTAWGMGRDAFRLLPDTATGFIGDVERSIELAADGRWGDAAEQFGLAFANVPGRMAGGVVDMGARFLRGGASMGLTAVGLEPPARRLSEDELQYLKQIYGDSIDYDMVRIKPGGPLNDTARTVGNTLYMKEEYFNDDGSLTSEGLTTLGHEMGHVWQNQNGGGDYMHNALWSQAWAEIKHGDRNVAYDWRKGLQERESFESMNDEQRAKVMEDIGVAIAGRAYDEMEPAEQTRVIADLRRAVENGGPALTAAEQTLLTNGIGTALAGDKSFGAMNEAERAQVMQNIRNTLNGIASFAASPPQEQTAILDSISATLADGRIDVNDGIRSATVGAYTPEEVAFLNEAWEKIKSGQGAG